MIREEYVEFIQKFEGLNPYELDHFCNVFYQHYQAALTDQSPALKADLAAGDVKEIIIRTMQMIQIEFAERKLKMAEVSLQRLKTKFP